MSAQAGGIDRAKAGAGADDCGAAGERGVGRDAGLHALVAVGNGGLHGGDGRGRAGGGAWVEFAVELAEAVELLDELAAADEQVTEQVEVGRARKGGVEILELAEAGEHRGVDVVVHGELADGFGESPGAQGIDQDGVDAGQGKASVEIPVIASYRFPEPGFVEAPTWWRTAEGQWPAASCGAWS